MQVDGTENARSATAPSVVAAAVAGGRLSPRDGEQLLGFLQLVDDVELDPTAWWSRRTWYRRHAQARALGLLPS